ncbi:MAG TPA: hypothetical protein VIG45_06570 [Erysipelothrix sp.]
MKNTKKKLLSILAFLLLLTACGNKGNDNQPEVSHPDEENTEVVQPGVETPIINQDFAALTTQSDLEAIIMGLYTESDLDPEFLEAIGNFHLITTLKPEDKTSQEAYFGGTYDFKEAKISESGISTSAYSLMLLRAEDAGQAKKLAQDISKSVNPNKWICVTAETVVSLANDDLVLVIMGEQKEATKIIETFKRLP